MDNMLYQILADVESNEQGKPTQEVIDSARDIAGNDSDMQKELDEIEIEIKKNAH